MGKPIEIPQLKSRLKERLSGSPVALAYIYGSYASGTFTKKSDIDIALVYKNKIEPRKALKIELHLGAWLDQVFHADFDVRSINGAPLKIKGEVVTQGILLYCADESFRVSFEVDTRKKYFDFLPALKYMRRIYLQSVKKRGLIDTTTNR